MRVRPIQNGDFILRVAPPVIINLRGDEPRFAVAVKRLIIKNLFAARIRRPELFILAILQIDSRIDLLKKAMLIKDGKSFYEFPASHFYAGMSIAVYDKGEIIEDFVAKVEFSNYEGEVFDL